MVFTDREKEVIIKLSEGYTVTEVSQFLGIAIFTVQSYVRSIRQKTGSKTIAGAVAIALREKVIQ